MGFSWKGWLGALAFMLLYGMAGAMEYDDLMEMHKSDRTHMTYASEEK